MQNKLTNIYVGYSEQFSNLENKDNDALYFITDSETNTQSMYKGGQKLGGNFIIVDGAAPENPEIGVIYYITKFGRTDSISGTPFVGIYKDNQWVSFLEFPISEVENVSASALTDLDTRLRSIENMLIEMELIWTSALTDLNTRLQHIENKVNNN